MMKKITAICLTVSLLHSNIMTLAANNVISPCDEYSNIIVNNGIDYSQSEPTPVYMVNGKYYFSIRSVTNHLGMDIHWDNNTSTISINSATDRLFAYMNHETYRCGYKDVYGNVVIEPIYTYAHDFAEGYGVVSPSPGYFDIYINDAGEQVSPVYLSAEDFHEGLALASVEENPEMFITDRRTKKHFIDKDGNPLFNKEFIYAGYFSYGYADVLSVNSAADKQTWMFINKNGEFANDMIFDYATSFEDGYAYVRQYGKWGIIDTDFNLAVNYQFDSMKDAKLWLYTTQPEYVDFNIVTDGKPIELCDGIFTVRDTTYLSADDIGNILGFDARVESKYGHSSLILAK